MLNLVSGELASDDENGVGILFFFFFYGRLAGGVARMCIRINM